MNLLQTQDNSQVSFSNRDQASSLSPALTGTPGYATDGNPNVPQPSTQIPAYHYDEMMIELANLMLAGGIASGSFSDSSNSQVYQAILAMSRVVDTGTANAYAGAPANALLTGLPALSAFPDGFTVDLLVGNTNTSSTPTFAWNGGSAITITREAGLTVTPGDMIAGYFSRLTKSGGASPTWLLRNPVSASRLAHGQVQLQYVSPTQLVLHPYGGGALISGSIQRLIPPAGLTVANTGVQVNGTNGQNLAASAVYYITFNGNQGTLNFWEIGTYNVSTAVYTPIATYSHTPDTTAGNAGIEVLTTSGVVQTNETLVGMVFTNASGQFQAPNGGQVAPMLNWFNRTALWGVTVAAQTGSSGASGVVEITSACRVPFLCWAKLTVNIGCIGYASTAAAGITFQTGVGVDGTNIGNLIQITGPATGYQSNISHFIPDFLSEGLHTASLFGSSSGSAVTTWNGLGVFVTTFG